MAHPPCNQNIQPPENFPPPEDRVSVAELADIFRVSIHKMYDLIRTGYPVWANGGRFVASRAHALAAVVRYDAHMDQIRAQRAERALARMPKARRAERTDPNTGLPVRPKAKDLIGVSEVARILRTSRARVYALAYAGELLTIPRPGSAALAFRRVYIEEMREKQEKELRAGAGAVREEAGGETA